MDSARASSHLGNVRGSGSSWCASVSSRAVGQLLESAILSPFGLSEKIVPSSYIASGVPSSRGAVLRFSGSDGKSFPDCGRSVPKSGKTFLGGIFPPLNRLLIAKRSASQTEGAQGSLLKCYCACARYAASSPPRTTNVRSVYDASSASTKSQPPRRAWATGPPAPAGALTRVRNVLCVCVSAVCGTQHRKSASLLAPILLNTPQRGRGQRPTAPDAGVSL